MKKCRGKCYALVVRSLARSLRPSVSSRRLALFSTGFGVRRCHVVHAPYNLYFLFYIIAAVRSLGFGKNGSGRTILFPCLCFGDGFAHVIFSV